MAKKSGGMKRTVDGATRIKQSSVSPKFSANKPANGMHDAKGKGGKSRSC